MSWHRRLLCIAEALLGPDCEADVHEKWTEARKSMSAPETYNHLVDSYLSAALLASDGSGRIGPKATRESQAEAEYTGSETEAAGMSTVEVLSGTIVRRRVLGKHLAFVTLNLQSTFAAPMEAAPAAPQQAVEHATAEQATAAVAFLSAELLPLPAAAAAGAGAVDTLSAFPSRKSMLQLGAAVVLGARPAREGESAGGCGHIALWWRVVFLKGENSQQLAKLRVLPRWCMLDFDRERVHHDSSYVLQVVGETIETDNKAAEAPAEASRSLSRTVLWFGDIPSHLVLLKELEQALRDCKPPTMPPPFISKVVRKGYRGLAAQRPVRCDGDQAVDLREPWFGFAFVIFRDEQEALEALDFFNGMEARGSWTMYVKWADETHQGQKKVGRRLAPTLGPGSDPPLGQQLFPVSFEGLELSDAVERHCRFAGVALRPGTDLWISAEVAKAFYRRNPRQEVVGAGLPIPAALSGRLLEELRRTRWPAALHRAGVEAQQYLVLHRGKANEGYESMLALLEILLAWTDPVFGCNRIAVTKDFQGSPHTDSSDVSFQYACSLGDFDDGGGQLCIEGACPGQVHVLNTHGRMARVDGRFVHWVRGHAGGSRYSLIFFATSPDSASEPVAPFHVDFVPHGLL
jgi:hypothetical protein